MKKEVERAVKKTVKKGPEKTIKTAKTAKTAKKDLGKINLLTSGIPGLDDILKGGVVEGAAIAVTGVPGSGKSIFGLQFIYEGCKKGEPCLYIASDESIDDIKREAIKINLDFTEFEKKGLITFIKEEPKPISITRPLEIIKKKKIKRVVLDNITLFEYTATSELEFRKSFLYFLNTMKNANVTIMVITQANIHDTIVEYKPHDFLFDGLIMLTKIRKGASFERCIAVLKMRCQEHLTNIFPFKIESGGIRIYTKQIPFSLK